jgi:hypothetical protein
MQSDLRARKLLYNVEIQGVNYLGSASESSIQFMTLGNPLPLVQDTSMDRVWDRWGVTYRDVWILDASNRVVGVFNLTSHDLQIDDNFNQLESMLVAAANSGDSDKDGLPDAWEERYLHGLAGGPNDDPDQDGFSNGEEFAFGTDPLDAASAPRAQLSFNPVKQFTVTLNRWAGTPFDYLADASSDLNLWNNSSTTIRRTVTNLYDGTGRSKVTWNLTKSTSTVPLSFIRVRAAARP